MMNGSQSYRRGLVIVLIVVLVSAMLAMARVAQQDAPPSAQNLGAFATPLGSFQLTERSGRHVTERDLAARVCIASFIFTRCPLSCPRISSIMKGLQEKLRGSSVLLLSLSVDPEHDTPQILDDYARRYEALPDRWWFLTGPRDDIYELIQTRFHLSVMANPAPVAADAGEAIAHSDRLALIEHGRVVGLFNSNDPTALDALIARAKRSALPAWVLAMPAINASLNGLSACLLLLGWRFARRGSSIEDRLASLPDAGPSPGHSPLGDPRIRTHRMVMLLAVLTSLAFLACYLVYHYMAGSVRFGGTGPGLLLYLTILISHTILATFLVVPLVITSLLRAFRGDYRGHKTIAALTFPIWLYVSVTGVVIYVMLYHLSPIAAALA